MSCEYAHLQCMYVLHKKTGLTDGWVKNIISFATSCLGYKNYNVRGPIFGNINEFGMGNVTVSPGHIAWEVLSDMSLSYQFCQ